MIPNFLDQIGRWLDRFGNVLNRWEGTLVLIERAYLQTNIPELTQLAQVGESIHLEISACKEERDEFLRQAARMGIQAKTIKELADHFPGQWPAIWTNRIAQLELQLNRVQRLSMTLWISAFQSQSIVSEMLLVLATGRSESATYSPAETQSNNGGVLINEAA